MNKRELEKIVNNSRRQQLMDKYVAEHGGEFKKWSDTDGLTSLSR